MCGAQLCAVHYAGGVQGVDERCRGEETESTRFERRCNSLRRRGGEFDFSQRTLCVALVIVEHLSC